MCTQTGKVINNLNVSNNNTALEDIKEKLSGGRKHGIKIRNRISVEGFNKLSLKQVKVVKVIKDVQDLENNIIRHF